MHIKRIRNFFLNIINHSRIKSIQFIISSSIALITILSMLFMGITLYNKFNKTAEQNAAITTRQIVEQININLDYYLRGMMEISDSLKDFVYYSEDINDGKFAQTMNAILGARKDIVSLAVFSENGELVVSTPMYKMKSNANIKTQDWFRAAIEQPANLFFSSPHVQNIYEGQHSWVLSLSREITYKKDGRKLRGVLLVDMNFSAIDQLCQRAKLGSRGYVYIIDSKGNIVYHPQQQLINIGLKSENISQVLSHVFGRYLDTLDGENRLITIDTVNYCSWRIVGIAYMDEIVSSKKEIGSFIAWTLVFGIFIVIFISAFISFKISQPIKKLEQSMKLVQEGNFDINVGMRGETEVAELANTFNLMVARIRTLMVQIVHEQESKRKSELDALQAQINPHFLYNTLDSIVWMAEHEKTKDVITMVTALARLFRISISRGKHVITVQQEIEHARNYLIIQKIRYKNKFNYVIEAQEEALQYKTLKLILQPIIENAIYHGIEYMVDEGTIKISVAIVDDKLLYKITDNGLGMKPETLNKLLSNDFLSKSGSGVGVRNVHERIQLYCGKEYGLEIESELEEGTCVKIWLAAEKDVNPEEVNNEKNNKAS